LVAHLSGALAERADIDGNARIPNLLQPID